MSHRLRVRTPDYMVIEYDIAGIGSRAAATVIDTAALVLGDAALFLGALAVVAHTSLTVLVNGGVQIVTGYILGFYILAAFLYTTLYYVLFESFWGGRTPGKYLVKLRVMTIDGRPVGLAGSLVRNVIRLVDLLPTGYLVGMITILLTEREQRLGDLAAGTVVVFDRQRPDRTVKQRRRARRGFPAQATLDATPALRRLAASCTARERELTLDLLARADALDEARANALAARILAGAAARTAVNSWSQPPYTAADNPLTVLRLLSLAWTEIDDSLL